MPRIIRHQSKKSNFEPYSKENRPIEKRNALQDIVAINGIKGVPGTNKIDVKKSNNKNVQNDNITTTTEKPSNHSQPEKSEISKVVDTKSPETRPSINNSKEITLYHSTIEEEASSEEPQISEELYETAIDKTQRQSLENNTSELYHSTVQELSSTNCNDAQIDTFEIDEINWNNFLYVGCYAREIFEYLRQREMKFIVCDYMSKQHEITPRHRAIVVNWLVDLQEIYGLNHEVLYMAVKIIDLYLMTNSVSKDRFQLMASGAILLSSKVDVREPGFPYDLVKQSKYLFTEDDLILMEKDVLQALDYDLNIPLSYVFLRRFARCMKCQMFLLTLARYILECSLLDYTFVPIKESLKAASSLYLAFKMCFLSVDENEFLKVTGYRIREIKDTVIALNIMLCIQSQDLRSVKQKYMHEIFYKVASKPIVSNAKLGFDTEP